MGGGDLNMKKSWHPLLLKNQERVWLEEKKALEEKKKLDQLRKEKEEERQLQELQRLQEQKTGKKKTEKLEWMYATPATGSNQNPNDLEDYLLGKKRVDKILVADDNAKLGASHKNFIAVQNANNARDIASKIREDPLLAIKQQEQAAYQALISNPLRLRELREKHGVKSKKDKTERRREKEEKKRLKEERRRGRERSRSVTPTDRHHPPRDHRRSTSYDRHRRQRSPSPYRSRSRSRSPPPQSNHDRRYVRSHSQTRGRSRSRSVDSYRRRRDPSSSVERDRPERNGDRVRTWPRSDESEDNTYNGQRIRRERSRSLERHAPMNGKRPRSQSPSYDRPNEKRYRVSPPPRAPRHSEGSKLNAADDRAARLASMTSNASTLTTERQDRLKSLLAREKAELEAEERARAKSKGMGSFLSVEQKKVFGGAGGLEERLRSGRAALVRSID